MKYISLTSVVDAYKSNRTRTKNKFWGLLSILSSIDNTVQPGISYDFSTARVASFLESLFRIDDTKKEYSNDNTWNIILSNQWTANGAALARVIQAYVDKENGGATEETSAAE